MTTPGRIILLNGAPRSGKSAIAAAIQERFEGVWINLGVDTYMAATPMRYRPGIGLRPGGERPDLEALIPRLYAALYESIAAHSRLGLNVVADLGHHDFYSRPLGILADCRKRLDGLPVLWVGVRCPVETVLERRTRSDAGAGGTYVTGAEGDAPPLPVLRWQEAVHEAGGYDLEIDTSTASPEACAETIRQCLLARSKPASSGPARSVETPGRS